MTEPRVFLVAGEASGDLHAANLVRVLRTLHPRWQFAGMGGERMAAAGIDLLENLVDRSVMGLRRVVREFAYVVDVAATYLEELDRRPPDLVVLVDYPGLNLNLARMARWRGIPVIYYICPQVWAWAPWRIRRVARRADMLLVILPFEAELYGGIHPRVHYVGNPVFDHLAAVEGRLEPPTGSPKTLALFPGSRTHEVEEALPVMLRIAGNLRAEFPDLEAVVSCHRPRLREAVQRIVAGSGVVAQLLAGEPHQLQRNAYFSLVVSGTAALEQAYFGVPMVVMYPARRWERRLFQTFCTAPFISLVNLFAGREIVPEFLFEPRDAAPIEAAARELLNGPKRQKMQEDLRRLRERAFHPGSGERAARRISQFWAER